MLHLQHTGPCRLLLQTRILDKPFAFVRYPDSAERFRLFDNYRLLLDKGADINAKRVYGRDSYSIIELAESNKDMEMVNLIKKYQSR